ncbi:ROK family protein [Streptomyces sp. ISL-86]|uniref:ROK family protein n=1 Tax=Streptomyces sp. ISL-86 TaxID=2819187 RepID=UPI001BEA13C3|nr:ROK family protein [Streptomyces sp. ISL-86]MBT2457622.1 ROK family protein [Streptomyces sp. ISL-86]
MRELVFTVADVGGTTLRTAHYTPETDVLADVHRVATQGIARYPDEPVHALQDRVVKHLGDQMADAIARHHSSAAAVAFAGPVTADGTVRAAPTIWGRPGQPLPLKSLLEERLGIPVMVINDVTAAVWRYASRSGHEEPFCLITVSSGIGSKIFWAGKVLMDSQGNGGELGHWTCDTSTQASFCECGGRGHLGALASGRGTQAAARRAASSDPDGYAQSQLAKLAPDPAKLDTQALAAAIQTGDRFATDILRAGLSHLASAITAVFTATGVRRFIIMGGFALAVGTPYASLLTEEIEQRGCFGLTDAEIQHMIHLGEPDDDHGLIGAGRLLTAQTALQPPTSGPTDP